MMLPLCKFYRYLIYRMYHFREDDTPVANVLMTLTVVHIIQLMAIVIVVDKCFGVELWPSFSKMEVQIMTLAFMVLHYFLLYDKKKWKSFDKEFKDETEKERKIGFWLVILYLVGSIILSFVAIILVC